MAFNDTEQQELILLSQAIENYYRNPQAFTVDDVGFLKQEADRLGIKVGYVPDPTEASQAKPKIGGAPGAFARFIGQPFIGYLEGMTTFRTEALQPENSVEGILRSIGHLGGFVAPWGVPHRATTAISKGVKKLIPETVAKEFAKRVKPHKYAMIGANLAESALKLGTMSAVSSWQDGVDGMVKAFFGGAEIGAGFHALQWIGSSSPNAALSLARVMAGAIYSGLPSTIRGDTAPEQVYQYLLGAYFTRKHRNIEMDKAFLGSKEMHDFSKYAQELDKNPGKEVLQSMIKSFWKNQDKIEEKLGKQFDRGVMEETPVEVELKESQREQQMDYFLDARFTLHNTKLNPIYNMADDFGIRKKSLTRALERITTPDYRKFKESLKNLLDQSGRQGSKPYKDADYRRVHNELLNIVGTGKTTMTYEDRTGEKYDTGAIVETPFKRDNKRVKKYDYRNALNDNFITVENTVTGKSDLYKTILELGREGYQVDPEKSVKEFTKQLDKQGLLTIGSPSDNDKIIVMRNVYKNYTKEQLAEQVVNKLQWSETMAQKQTKRYMQEALTTYDAIDQIWGQPGMEYFRKLAESEGANKALNEFIKRLQIPAARGISPPSDVTTSFNRFLNKRNKTLKVTEDENIRTMVVDDAFFEQVGINKKDWISRFGANKDGSPAESLIGDGAEYLHPKLFELLNKGMGEDISSNFGKWFTHTKGTKADGDYIVSIKSGTFRAGKELTNLMERLGVGRIVLSSAVKVKSDNIIPVKLKWDAKKGWRPTIDGKENYKAMEQFVFNTKPQDMKFKFSAHEESAGGAGAVGMLQQLMNFMEAESPASRSLWNRVIEDQLQSVNDTVNRLTSPGGHKELEQYIAQLMKTEDRELVLSDIEQPSTDKPVSGEKGKWTEKYDAGFQSAFNLLGQSMRKQTLQILTNDLIRKRLLRPMHNGGFFVIEPMLPDNYAKTFSGEPLKPDEIILPKSVREAVVFTAEGKRTLGDIIDAELKKGNTRIDLSMLAARSPVSAVNAVKNLYLAGIREDEGYTAIIHPRVVKEIKGDFDADKIHVYWNLPKEVTKYFSDKANSQETSKYIYDIPEHKDLKNQLFNATDIAESSQRMRKALDFVIGKKSIGEFANNIQRYEKALTIGFNERIPVTTVRVRREDGSWNYGRNGVKTYIKRTAERLIREGNAKKIKDSTIGVRVKKADPKSVREFLDAWLNTAVDSGKLGGLPSSETYRKMMLDTMFEAYDVPDTMNRAIFAVRESRFWKEFTDFRSVINKDFSESEMGRVLDFNDVVDRAARLKNPGLNVEHLVARLDKSKKLTLENYTKTPEFKRSYKKFADRFSLSRDFEKQIRKVRKIGDKTVELERSHEYDRNLSRDIMRAALMAEILPEVDGKYNFVQIRRALKGGEEQFEPHVKEYLQKVFKDIDPKIIKKVRAISSRIQKELPQGVDMNHWKTIKSLESIREDIARYSKLLSPRQLKQFMYLLDIPELAVHHYGLGLEIKDVHSMPQIERGKANVFDEMFNSIVGVRELPVGKQPSNASVADVVKETFEPKLKRGSSSGDENPPEGKEPYVEWRGRNKELDKLAENLKEYPDFAESDNLIELMRFIHQKPKLQLEDITYRDLWGLNRFFADLKSQGLVGLIQKNNKLGINWVDDLIMPERSGFKLRQIDREWVRDPDSGIRVPMSAMDQLVYKARDMHSKMNEDAQVYEKLVSDRIDVVLSELRLNKKETLDLFKLAVMKHEGRDKAKDSIYRKKWGEVAKEYNALPKEQKQAVDRVEEEIRILTRQFHKEWIKGKLDPQRAAIAEEFGLKRPKETGEKEFYFPHSWHRKDFAVAFEKKREEEFNALLKRKPSDDQVEEFNKKWDKLYEDLVVRRVTEDQGHGFYPVEDGDIPELQVKLASDFSNMRTRGLDIQDYRYEPGAVTDYVRRAIRTYHMNELGKEGRRVIDSFVKRMEGKMSEADIKKWKEFMTIYLRDNISQPSKPSQILKKSLYNTLSDTNAIEKWNAIAGKLGIEKLKLNNPMDLVNLNNLDAKFNLGALLFSTKTFVANVLGGEANTIILSGMRPSIDAFNLYFGSNKDLLAKYIPKEYRFKKGYDPLAKKETLTPLSNREVINRYLKVHGVIEEFLEYEAYLGKSGKGKELWKSLSQEVDQIYEANGKITKQDVFKAARKLGISEDIATKAGFFMRISEKPLRAMSFLTGYMNAKDKGFNEQIAVAMGKKHIQATQYLYSNAFRPAFARTNLGKILTRFQFWTWSSVKFRRELAQKASYVGFKPGSEQYEALKRMMTFDLFMLGMANMFVFSLFESALPPPYNYAQDTAQLLFGDDDDRKNAFFGTYGLNVVLPAPSARIPVQLFKSMLSNDWERFANYHIWTWFPFGRFTRDVKRFTDTPAYTVEIFSGLPVHKMSGYKKKRAKLGDTLAPKGIITGSF